jgi:hypothetical protein
MVGEHEELSFGEDGLTIVYGQNGVGKTSYVRVLKKLCRTVDRDCQLRGSIYDTIPPAPGARMKVKCNGAVTERRTSLEASAASQIAGMSVFDSASAELYVDSQNEVQYIPSELRLLARLATLQDRMRRDLVAEREELQRRQPPIVDYPPETRVGQVLRGLTGGFSDHDLAHLAALNDTETARIAEIRLLLAFAQTSTARADAAAAEREGREADVLAGEMETLASRLSRSAIDGLLEAIASNREAEEAVRLAVRELEGPLAGVGGGPWQIMWRAARTVVESEGGTFPTPPGEVCPLCLQTVTAETAGRLSHFQEHITGHVRATSTERAEALRRRLADVSPDQAEQLAASQLLGTRANASHHWPPRSIQHCATFGSTWQLLRLRQDARLQLWLTSPTRLADCEIGANRGKRTLENCGTLTTRMHCRCCRMNSLSSRRGNVLPTTCRTSLTGSRHWASSNHSIRPTLRSPQTRSRRRNAE